MDNIHDDLYALFLKVNKLIESHPSENAYVRDLYVKTIDDLVDAIRDVQRLGELIDNNERELSIGDQVVVTQADNRFTGTIINARDHKYDVRTVAGGTVYNIPQGMIRKQ